MPYSEYYNNGHAQSNKQLQMSMLKTNKSGVVGVHFEKDRNKWCSDITYTDENGIRQRIKKRFNTKEEAVAHQMAIRNELLSKIPDEQQHLNYLIRRYKANKLSVKEKTQLIDLLLEEHYLNNNQS